MKHVHCNDDNDYYGTFACWEGFVLKILAVFTSGMICFEMCRRMGNKKDHTKKPLRINIKQEGLERATFCLSVGYFVFHESTAEILSDTIGKKKNILQQRDTE